MTESSLFAIGLAAGVLAGMFGIGGGRVIVPALLFAMNLGEKQDVATDRHRLAEGPAAVL